MSPEFLAGVRAGLDAAARRYDSQREAIERLGATETDKREIERYRSWAHSNRVHADELRLMAGQFTAAPFTALALIANG